MKLKKFFNIITRKIYEERLEDYKRKKHNVETGGINCIPSPFKRFVNEFPGIEKKKYYCVTANQKVNLIN